MEGKEIEAIKLVLLNMWTPTSIPWNNHNVKPLLHHNRHLHPHLEGEEQCGSQHYNTCTTALLCKPYAMHT